MLKKLAGQTAIYGLSSIIGRTLNFLLVPFYTSPGILEPSEYGIVTELYAYVAFLNIIYLYGMETTYFRFSTRGTLDEDTAYNNALTSIIFTSLLFSGLIIISAPQIATLLNYPGRGSFFVWLGLILALDAITAIPFARLRLEKKASWFATTKIINISVNIGLNLFFLVFCKKVYNGLLFPELRETVALIYHPSYDVAYIFISNFAASLLMVPLLWRSFSVFRIRWNTDIIRPMLIYSFPLLFIGLAGMTDEMLSRMILRHVLPENFYPGRSSLEALGIFGACYKLSMFMTLAVQAFRYAADPFFFSSATDKQAPELFAKVMKWFIIACTFIFVVVSANLSLFEQILRSPVYREAIMVVPVLLLANLFLGIYYNLSMWYKLTDKTRLGSVISFIGAGITIVFNFLLIPYLGYMGSALTTLICYMIMTAISYYWGKKYFPVPYNLASAAFYILLGCALVAAALWYPFGKGTMMGYAWQVMMVVMFLVVMVVVERKNKKD